MLVAPVKRDVPAARSHTTASWQKTSLVQLSAANS
jgi:hypothetical protein